MSLKTIKYVIKAEPRLKLKLVKKQTKNRLYNVLLK